MVIFASELTKTLAMRMRRTKTRILLLCAIVVVAMGLYGTAHAATLASKRFSVRNGLPTNAVHYITQDNHGYIWAGTSNGLIRYDGYNFLTFDPWNNKDGIQGEGSITDISNDSDNNLLYLFTPRRTMICLDLNNFEFSNYGTPEEMAKEYRSHVKTKNALWQFNKKGDVRRVTYNNGKFDIKIYSKENALLPDSNITTVKEDSKGNAWIVTQKGLVKVKPDGESTIVAKDKNTRAFCTYDDRIVYTFKEGTLVVADLNGKQIKVCNRLPRRQDRVVHRIYVRRHLLLPHKPHNIRLRHRKQ